MAGPTSLLPELRPELELMKGAASATGEPGWLVHDPLLNRFLQIDVATFETLTHWRHCRTAGELLARVNAGGQVHVEASALEQLIGFLQSHRLTADGPAQGWRDLAREDEAKRQSVFGALVHNYLFLRIPLLRPQTFLERTLPLARALASRPVQWLLWGMALAGLYLVSREWDQFVATLEASATLDGAILMGAALVLVKAAHELGHAYTAAHYGCRVHTLGVAFIVMAPLLYTDVTDSWRLRDRRQRLAIDSAGIKVELAIAAVALLLWAFLPDGGWRSVAFTLSAVSVASSLAINLNPFMRFDGYYLMAEALGVDNLQARAFDLGRWKLREWLFGLGKSPPEDLPRGLAGLLIAYAWAVWVYRLVLFVGIAVLVYNYFFKALGIVLFGVEIVYFVGRPIMNEIRIWHRERHRIIATKRTLITASLAGFLVCSLLVPWSMEVQIPAVAESAQLQPVHPVRPARVVEVPVQHGAQVKVGDVLARLESPDIEHEIDQTRTRLALARVQHGRRGADAEDRAGSIVLESSLASLQTRLEGLEKERDELVLRAPFDGRVVELDLELQPGRWVSPKDQLAIVAGAEGITVRGYVSESDLWRIAPGAAGTFVPEMPTRRRLPVRVDVVASASAAEIEIADLASVHAGRIAVVPDGGRRLVPTTAQYLVRMSAEAGGIGQELSVRGVVHAEGRAESMLARFWRQALKVLLREAGA